MSYSLKLYANSGEKLLNTSVVRTIKILSVNAPLWNAEDNFILRDVLLSQNYEINLARFSDNFKLHQQYDEAMNNKNCVSQK
jgi:hypothetical protein